MKLIQSYLDKGLSVIPVNADKTPAIKWQLYQKEFIKNFKIFDTSPYIAVVCGEISGNLICIDIDLKYDLSGDLYDRIRRATPPQLYKKLWVQKTLNGGYHWIYRVKEKVNGGNTKLANRPTTNEEKNATYTEELKIGKSEEDAINIAKNDKVRVLIETRQEGGYFIVQGEGYMYVEGKLDVLTISEHEDLLTIMRSFNEYFPVVNEPIKEVITVDGNSGVHPFEAFNNNGDVHEILINNGWSYVFEDNERVYYKRPGFTTSLTSGHYHKEKKLFKVFSTSTILEPNKAYTPASLFTELECNGDRSKAIDKLHELGYGDKDESDGYIKKLARLIHKIGKSLDIEDGSVLEKAELIIEKLNNG